ncbi:MAG: AAA family ATPase, partial [Thermodesulfobacteriota bacterium]|nr:AAA family ATPase [Thermodesulfobacteriota bacterium]
MVSKKHIPRYISQYAFNHALVGNHMVFLAGPRQVGKTMLARNWLKRHGCSSLYYNWDDRAVRQAYLSDSRFFEPTARSLSGKNPWLVFDEIHKRNQWRDILKSAYDLFGDEFRFLVTGSARLDMFRRAGDSLVGRYNLFHMMPFSPPEILGRPFSPCFLQEENAQKRVTMFTRRIEAPNAPEVREVFEALYRYG